MQSLQSCVGAVLRHAPLSESDNTRPCVAKAGGGRGVLAQTRLAKGAGPSRIAAYGIAQARIFESR